MTDPTPLVGSRYEAALAASQGYRVLTPPRGYHHLGHKNWGTRTQCGRVLAYAETLIELPGSIGVTCLSCQRSTAYALAVARGVQL